MLRCSTDVRAKGTLPANSGCQNRQQVLAPAIAFKKATLRVFAGRFGCLVRARLLADPAGIQAKGGLPFGFHIAGAVYFRVPFAHGLIFPFGYTAGALIALDGLRCCLDGFVRWKGRVYR
jgi:hypothetical protein